jgi:hypothetical protein
VKEGRLARATHVLSSAEGGTSQDIETKEVSDGYSPPVEHRRDKSGPRKQVIKDPLTFN